MSDTEEPPAVEEVAEMSVLDALREVRSLWSSSEERWRVRIVLWFSEFFDSGTVALSLFCGHRLYRRSQTTDTEELPNNRIVSVEKPRRYDRLANEPDIFGNRKKERENMEDVIQKCFFCHGHVDSHTYMHVYAILQPLYYNQQNRSWKRPWSTVD